MMTKTTSKVREALSQLSIVPVLAGLIFISCSKSEIVPATLEKDIATNEVTYEVTQHENEDSMEYPGGLKEFYKFVKDNYKSPVKLEPNADILVIFTVETDGTLSDFLFARSPNKLIDNEMIRILKLSPKWVPYKRDGKPIRQTFATAIKLN